MAASSVSTSSVDADKYTELEPDATFILYMFKEDDSDFEEKQILVETEANITLFLFEWEVKSRKIDPRKYHWHCVHRGSYFHLRSAFSGKMLRTDSSGLEHCHNSKAGCRLVTAEDCEDEGAFCVLKESRTHSMLYHMRSSTVPKTTDFRRTPRSNSAQRRHLLEQSESPQKL